MLLALLAAPAAMAGVAPLVLGGDGTASERAEILAALTGELAAMPALAAATSIEQRRHALVIGIDRYDELRDLNKAIGDTHSVSAALEGLGFAVTRLENVDTDAFDTALDTFYDGLGRGDVAFFFFAGHGVSFEGGNYLLPADMPALERVRASRLDRYAVDAGRIVDEIKSRGVEIAFVVLDACRDNPFPEEDSRSARIVGGLARMTPREGAFVIYSAGIGEKALDRLGPGDPDPNSVFTRKFWPILKTPGLPVVEIAKRTQVEVNALAATVNRRQAPAYYDQVIGQFYFRPPEPKLFGMVIGIDDYGGRADLKGAVNDAERIAHALEAIGAERVERILNADARLRFIEYVWNDLLDRAGAGDTIVFTFAGQSSREPTMEARPEEDDEFLILSGRQALASLDVLADDPGRKLTDKQLTAWMADAAARNVNVILFVDGCHAGGMLDREFANVSFIGAAQAHEVAIERRFGETTHGVASYAFARAFEGAADLNGDGYVSQRELFAFLDQHIFHMSAGRQNPEFLPALTQSGVGLALARVPQGGDTDVSDLRAQWRESRAPARPLPQKPSR